MKFPLLIFDRGFYFFWQKAVKHYPRIVGAGEKPVFFSKTGKVWTADLDRGIGGWLPCSNHSFGYHGLLREFWEHYGLGAKCLLVSESIQVAEEFSKLYPRVEFISTDYFLDVRDARKTHILWNLYHEAPALKVDSIVCQATLEHIMDPVGVLKKFASLLMGNGFLYLHTHTPLYPHHPCPKDYLRYHPEWFQVVTEVVPELEVLEVACIFGHAFAVYQKRV